MVLKCYCSINYLKISAWWWTKCLLILTQYHQCTGMKEMKPNISQEKEGGSKHGRTFSGKLVHLIFAYSSLRGLALSSQPEDSADLPESGWGQLGDPTKSRRASCRVWFFPAEDLKTALRVPPSVHWILRDSKAAPWWDGPRFATFPFKPVEAIVSKLEVKLCLSHCSH